MGYISVDQSKDTRITTIVLLNDALPILVNEPIRIASEIATYVVSHYYRKLKWSVVCRILRYFK